MKLGAVLSLLSLSGWAAASDRLVVETIAAPIPDESLTPFLAASSSRLHLTWLEESTDGHRLRHVSWDGSRFSSPSTIHTSSRFFANWADFSSVVAFGDGRLAAHWLEKSASGTYDYDVLVSVSDDGGKSWGPGMKPHRDGTASEHGFVSLVPNGANGFAIAWLDGRNFVKDAEDHEMTLMFSTFEGPGFREEILLDGRVCECCQTGMAAIEGGFFVAYRDRSPEEIRDISYVRSAGGAFDEPRRLSADGWHLTGCPVNGPQVARNGDRLAVAWFTGSKEDPRVQVVFSENSGESFGGPIRVDDGRPLGRVDIELVESGAVVSWLSKAEERGAEVLARRVAPDGSRSEVVTVARTGADRASGFPRMASFDGRIYIAWTEALSRKGPSRVHLARMVVK